MQSVLHLKHEIASLSPKLSHSKTNRKEVIIEKANVAVEK